jgi:hypothetical protein
VLLLRDAAVITTAMGHTALMHKGSALVTVEASSSAGTACALGQLWPAAGVCCGNRLERAPPSSASTSRPPGLYSCYPSLPKPKQLQQVIPQHQNSHKGVVGVALPFTRPHACQLLKVCESRARKRAVRGGRQRLHP